MANGEVLEERKRLIKLVGEEVWNILHATSQNGISTSLHSYYNLSDTEDMFDCTMDYSGVIITVCKALEYELKNRFYIKYLLYLRQEYSVYEYLKINGIDIDTCVKKRGKVLVDRDPGIEFIDPTVKSYFMLGNFLHGIGISINSKAEIDNTLVEFINYSLFGSVDEEIVREWIFQFARDVSAIKLYRNNSAHGGLNLDRAQAYEVLKQLLLVKKVLFVLMKPTQFLT